jgi:hypothetical protein
MSDQIVRVPLIVSMRHIGFTANYFKQGGQSVAPSRIVEAKYKSEKGDAKIFTEKPSGKKISPNELISWLLRTSGKRKQELITQDNAKKAFDEGLAIQKHDFRIECEPNSLFLRTIKGPMDIKLVVFYLEFTIRPKKQS